LGEATFAARKPRASIAPLITTLIAGALCYGIFYRRGLGLAVIGYSIAPTERVLHGEVPYRDFLFNYTPGILWFNALLMKCLGVSLMTVRIGLFAVKLITLVLIYEVGRRVTSGPGAFIPVGLTLAWLGYEHIFNPYPDVYFMPLALAAMLFALSYDKSGKTRWLLFIGLAAGGVLLFKHNVGLFVFICAAIAVTIRECATGESRSRKMFFSGLAKRLGIMAIGFGAVALSLAAYLYSRHALGAMVEHFLHHASAYSESRSIGLPPVKQLWPMVAATLAGIAGAVIALRFAPRLLIPFLGLIAILLAGLILVPNRAFLIKQSATATVGYLPVALFVTVAVAMLWRGVRVDSSAEASWLSRLRSFLRAVLGQFQSPERRREWWAHNGTILIVMLISVGVYLEMFPRADYYHLVRVLPPVFLLLTAALWRLRPALEKLLRPLVPRAARAGWLVVAAVVVLSLATGWEATWRPQFDSRMRFVDRKELGVERGHGILAGERQAALVDGLAGLIQENSAPDDSIFSFSQRASAFYFLAARRNPTRFLWWRSVGISKQERDAVLEMISNRQPKLVIIQEIPATQKQREFLGQYYHRLGAAADLAVYGRD
jgi:hypothetical protein